MSVAVDDPEQPEWQKQRSLMEIELNRESQKYALVQ
jgi:hypothetical protein